MEYDERFEQFYNEMVEKNSCYMEQVRREANKGCLVKRIPIMDGLACPHCLR